MKYIIAFLLIILNTGLQAQCGNVFRNGSFEEKADFVGANVPDEHSQAHKSRYWADDHHFEPFFPCYFSPSCYYSYHSPDWFDGDADGMDLHFSSDPECGGYVTAYEGTYFIGMGRSELIEQNVQDHEDLMTGQSYVFSMKVHLMKSTVVGSTAWLVPNPFTDPNPHIKVLIGKNKIEYQDNDGADPTKHFGPLQDIIQVLDWEIDMSQTQEWCDWQTIQGSFTAPANANTYDWVAIELQETGSDLMFYLAIDDVMLTKGCLISCSRTDGTMNNIYAPGNIIDNANAFQVLGINNISEANMRVYNEGGYLVYERDFHCTNGFENGIFWYGKTNSGADVATGQYRVEITADNDCGNSCGLSEFIVMVNQPYLGAIVYEDCYQGEIKTPEPCCELEPDLYLDNINFDGPGLLEYSVINGIYCSFFGPDVFLAGSEVEMKAGNEIVIGSNVHIQAGSDFHAFIQPCTRSASAGNVIDLGEQTLKTLVPSNDQLSMSFVQVYPNPNNGIFDIEVTENIGPCSVKITDTQGKLVYSRDSHDFSDGNTLHVDLGLAGSGIYVVEVSTPENRYRSYKKLIID